jgi:hypothetical protein
MPRLVPDRSVAASSPAVGYGSCGTIVRVFIHQHWLQRFGSVIPAGLVMSAFIFTAKTPIDSAGLFILVIFVLVPLWLVIRSFRAGVKCEEHRLLIRGWFWSRSIPRNQIVKVTDRKFVEWTSKQGSTRYSPLLMFWTWPRSYGLLDSYNSEALLTVARWVGHEQEHGGRHVDTDGND